MLIALSNGKTITLNQIKPFLWEIPITAQDGMHVPARFYATESMIADLNKGDTFQQLMNVASLPGVLHYALGMPDMHAGYGFPIGGVAATRYPDGVISPGGIGYDINCGVRLIKTPATYDQIKDRLEEFSLALHKAIPSGLGKGGTFALNDADLDGILKRGAAWTIEKGYGNSNDAEYIESQGCLNNADPSLVSEHARSRGIPQLGTLGAGNHFVEVNRISTIYNQDAAATYGLTENQVVVQIHTGSRGLGHQVATDFIKIMKESASELGLTLPDPTLSCAPLSSKQGSDYFNAMAAAANYAWANRQILTYIIRTVWQEVFGNNSEELPLLYDVAHNIAKIEEHTINGETIDVIMHRKGATRAFGKNNPEIPLAYQAAGQPVLVPGSMGTASYVLAGLNTSMEQSLGSSCHGAGRVLSRAEAKGSIVGEQVHETLRNRGIFAQTDSISGLAEEAPQVYKNIHDVVDIIQEAAIANKVAQLVPCCVIKG